ncbi:MAG: hypothetical protein JXM73_25090 [Anaerolineae bacterium]|nr:hypothetical protein [Anaerolineae bacterium]
MKRLLFLLCMLAGMLLTATLIVFAGSMPEPTTTIIPAAEAPRRSDGLARLELESAASTVYTAEVWVTTGDQTEKLNRRVDVNFSPGAGDEELKIQVDGTTTYQEMDGFGAALTDSATWLIFNIPEPIRTNLLNDLFSSTAGIGLSYLRLPMGACDFTPPISVTGFPIIYTYDDNGGQPDPGLANFSIARDDVDHYKRIPLLQQAKSINPELKLMGSPWTAPAWMKDSGSPITGSLMTTYYDEYAQYFVKFVLAYSQTQGLPIHAVVVQNEPRHEASNYPSMPMEPEQQADFIGGYLGPAFADAGINTKILTWDHNWDGWLYPITVMDILSDTDKKDYVDGSAWHCYCSAPPDCEENTPDKQDLVHDAHPDKDIYFTECTGTGGILDDFGQDLKWGVQTIAIGTIRNWARTVLYWNLALDEKGKPHTGGCRDCRGLVAIDSTGTYTKSAEYYIVGHLSKFIDPGARRIESSFLPNILETVAFQNPDDSIVLVVLNPKDPNGAGEKTVAFDVQWKGLHFSQILQPQSVATFKWRMYVTYLPLIAKTHLSSRVFHDFEPDHCTPAIPCWDDKWRTTCWLENQIVYEGQRSLGCYAHEKPNEPGNGGTVVIYPIQSPLDLSSSITMCIEVNDTQGSNTIELRLHNNIPCLSQGVWSREEATRDQWTRICWYPSDFENLSVEAKPEFQLVGCPEELWGKPFDGSQVTAIELYEWNDGVYYFDRVHYWTSANVK